MSFVVRDATQGVRRDSRLVNARKPRAQRTKVGVSLGERELLPRICQAMGVALTDNRFGDPAFCTGPLTGLTA